MSSEPLTDHDLGVLRAAGLPLVTHTVVPSPAATELMASIGKAVEEGTPRLVEASALALVTLSPLTDPPLLDAPSPGRGIASDGDDPGLQTGRPRCR